MTVIDHDSPLKLNPIFRQAIEVNGHLPTFPWLDMVVSRNGGNPKSSIYRWIFHYEPFI